MPITKLRTASVNLRVKKPRVLVLWLTARLASRLVPHLCQLTGDTASPMAKGGDDNDPPQARGRRDHGGSQHPNPPEPVVAGADSAEWVVTAVDLTNGPMLVQLGFRDDQGHAPVLLSLEHTQLAEWSEGLKRCYAQAGWSMDCWHIHADASPQSFATRRVALH